MTNEQAMASIPAVRQASSEIDELIVLAEFPTITPEALFDYWTQPALLCRWWPQEAELDLRVDGAYHLSWPKMDWHLRGHYTAVEPCKRLAFTWKWDSDPELAPIRQVNVTFVARAEGGAQITVTHGSYTNSEEDQQERAGHLDGWTHFLGKLQKLFAQGQEQGDS